MYKYCHSNEGTIYAKGLYDHNLNFMVVFTEQTESSFCSVAKKSSMFFFWYFRFLKQFFLKHSVEFGNANLVEWTFQ